ncbi:MAG: ribosomal-protein-serine acetyltransferase [Francisella sp.]|jgi:ribosomal-protein-serine acetyltransferase
MIRVSEKIYLERLLITDAKKIFELVEENRKIFHYLDWVDSVRCISSAQKYISKRVQSTNLNSEWFKVILNDTIVGVFGIKYVCYDKLESEIGYWLAEIAQGYGVVSQSINSIKEYLKDEGIKTIKISCISENVNAIAVAVRAGGIKTKSVKNYKSINKKIFDLNVYSIRL